MIGYWIVIAAQTSEERDLSIDRKAAVLANWETGRAGSAGMPSGCPARAFRELVG